MKTVLILPGDGIGPEIMASAKTLLTALDVPIQINEALAGGAALAEGLDLIPPETLARITDADATLKGPITTPIGRGFSSVNVSLRQHFELYANVRRFYRCREPRRDTKILTSSSFVKTWRVCIQVKVIAFQRMAKGPN